MQNNHADEIKEIIKGFKAPQREFFAECMMLGHVEDSYYYKGAIFTCDKSSVSAYKGISDFWVRSFYALVENAWLGDLFHKVIPLIHWEPISSDVFVNQYRDMMKECDIESMAGKKCVEIGAPKNLDSDNINFAVNVLKDSVISSIAISNENYISYFILNDEIGIRRKWPKGTP